ncbi:SGNH/GDSL hydrolase family protein [Lentzea californiensis]|uniref:SGNH/GDSL hydrolase family protein n=1 Tax=Lentzea californiensis TaxID=438851 RepID=UPI0021659089|nr:SGNH/GDSL hydrolase family protein [Lentzea californiensis]MCR3752105.1 Lysophospholipase L1 [Lentzea californiensis]
MTGTLSAPPLYRNEKEDPRTLDPGASDRLLAGAPWRRFAVIGDSVAAGVGEDVDGYGSGGWADRIAGALESANGTLGYLNLGRRGLRLAEVREQQLARALAFEPDLAAVACGGNDVLRRDFDPDEFTRAFTDLVSEFTRRGVTVITVGVFDISRAGFLPARLSALLGRKVRTFSERTAGVAAELGAVHVSLTWLDAAEDPSIWSEDRLHVNGRGNAIAAAVAIRELASHLETAAR